MDFNNLHEIKTFTCFYIDEHDRLSEEDKSKLHQFVIEADLKQMQHLLITGKMENDPQIMSEVVTSVDITKPALAVVAAAAVLGLAAYKNYFSKAAKACKGKAGLEKKNCIAKFKKQAQRAKVTAMQKAMSQCSKSKDPATCKQKLQTKITKEKAKMGEL